MTERNLPGLSLIVAFATAIILRSGNLAPARAQSPQSNGSGPDVVYNPYPAGLLPSDLPAELARVQREVDGIEQEAIQQWKALPLNTSTRQRQVEILGKLELYDRNLSVNRNLACTSCHMPYAGFTNPIPSLAATTVSFPGSVLYRMDSRKPQDYAYAPFFPALHYRESTNQFFGGNFWDLRATGDSLQNPSSRQAEMPPTDAEEMGLPDTACVVYRLSQAVYRPLFEHIWGAQAFRIHWPSNVEQICDTPAGAAVFGNNMQPLALSASERGRSNTTYDQFAQAIVGDEYGADVSPFTSKFDAFLAGKYQLSPDEQAGWVLFNGKGKCEECHLDGAGPNGDTTEIANQQPLFTDFSAHNLGTPRNDMIPYLYESTPDPFGYTPNPQGTNFIDLGLGLFLRGQDAGAPVPNGNWANFAEQSDGEFQTSTVRDVDLRPCANFTKSYFHNGFAKSLKEVVHFYNTRDVLPRCAPGAPGEGVTCWPPPEVAQNEDKTIGNLGLTDQEENQIVDFMQTLTDGYIEPLPDANTYTGNCQ